MSNQLNLILKGPHLSRCKVLLIDQSTKSVNLKPALPRHIGRSSSSSVEWSQSNSGTHNNKLLLNKVLYTTQTLSKLAFDNNLRGVVWNGTTRRYMSQNTSSKPNDLVTQSDGQVYEDVPEEEFVINKFSQTELVPEVPIKGLNIDKRINKVSKKGSFSVDIFTGSYDHDYLTYPEPLDNRIENQQLKDQANMVKQLWPQIWEDDRQLQKYNFFNLFQLSVTEMMTIFEAIGASSRLCYEMKLPSVQDPNNSVQQQQQQTLVSKAIISLITRTCLTYWPMSKSENFKMKEFLPKEHIVFGGSATANTQEPYLPIGFCWTEQATSLGSLPPQEWQTFGQNGGAGVNHHLITGRKNKVLLEDSTEHYLVYFRDKFLAEKYENEAPENESNPASDPFVGCCLLHKSEVKHGPIYHDSAGFKYTDIEFDITVPDDRILFSAQRNDPKAVNIKALGQVATCSVTLGILKDSLRRTYKYLLESKRGLLNCDIIERKLATVTSKIFAIESMVYYIAGMYDGLEEGFDAHMEATILKIVTNEYAYAVLQELQQVCGSEMFILSKLQDQINIFDSFLDGNIYNRLYLATMGVIWFARSKNIHLNQLRLAPWYPGYFLKHMIRETSEQSHWLTLKADIYGNLHPSLKEAGVNLEYILKRVKYAAENLCMKYGKDVTGAQSALYRLAQLSIDSFMLTTLCARASKSYCNGSRNSEIDVALATNFSRELVKDVRLYVDEIHATPLAVLDNRAKTINELNLKMGGYYAESPLDPNI